MARPRQITDEAILTAARDCVYEHGGAVSTTVIADCVGVSQATLFKRFGTKEDLLLAALAPPPELDRRWLEGLRRGPTPGDMEPQFRAVVLDTVQLFEQLLPRMAALKAACLMELALEHLHGAGQDAPPIRGRKALTAWLERARDLGQLGPCNPQSVSIALIGACMGLASRRHILGDTEVTQPPEAYAAELANILWKGLAPEEGIE